MMSRRRLIGIFGTLNRFSDRLPRGSRPPRNRGRLRWASRFPFAVVRALGDDTFGAANRWEMICLALNVTETSTSW